MHNVFGPVPSRRLGRSIGINNIPPKVCSYACIYCQVGQTSRRERHQQVFYDPKTLVDETKQKLDQLEKSNENVDYLTIVSDGEPTLDANLGALIHGLKLLGFPIAVLTNASLLDQASVRDQLGDADCVSLKIDASSIAVWEKINRPVHELSLPKIKEGIRQFSNVFRGRLVTETMLVKNVNDQQKEITGIADFLSEIQPNTAYIAVPTRPPVVPTIRAADSRTLVQAFDIFASAHLHAEFLIGYEGSAFAATGSTKDDLLSITAVHPMRQDAVEAMLHQNSSTWREVDQLIAEHQLKRVFYNDEIYYTRQLTIEQQDFK